MRLGRMFLILVVMGSAWYGGKVLAFTNIAPSAQAPRSFEVLQVDSRRSAIRLESGWFRVDRRLFKDMKARLKRGVEIRYEVKAREKKLGGKGVISFIQIVE